MGGFSQAIGSSLTSLTQAIIGAPTSIINSAANAGSGVIGNSGGFLGGLFNFNTGSALATATGKGINVPAGLQGSLNYGGDDDFLTKNKGLFTGVLLITLVLGVVYFIFGKKKKVGRKRRRVSSFRTVAKPKRSGKFVARSRGAKTFKVVSQRTYDGYTRRQKNLYNLAKGRAKRAKAKR